MKSKTIQIFGKSFSVIKILFITIASVCLFPWISSSIALALGLVTAQLIGNPFKEISRKAVNWLLKISVIGLGFGMNMFNAFRAGEDSFLFTVASITTTLILGLLIGKYFGIDKKISQLISCGTAICGGSAISAISPIIKADNKQISISIGIVFLLNSIALFTFPPIGHLLELSQHQFGVWSAIAIHDTSSVVGAAEIYGDKALEVATTVKLARALWIIPVSLLFAVFSKAGINKVRVPYFIGLFVLAIIANTYSPSVQAISPYIVKIAKTALTLTLFLIGSGLTFRSLKNVGVKPVLLAMFLWVFISISSLMIIVKTVL
jgi:uncharacterized integral membrane protein (TIGR00698 family)